jgi:hypothetical protein
VIEQNRIGDPEIYQSSSIVPRFRRRAGKKVDLVCKNYFVASNLYAILRAV